MSFIDLFKMKSEVPTIKITTQGAVMVNIDDLLELHQFKTLTDDAYAKCHNSMTDPDIGFSFPFSIWIDSEGKKWTVDGHQRLRTLKRMKQEGYIIPELPANLIIADSKRIAAKRIVASDSRYGDINQSDFTEFLDEFKISFEEIEPFMDIDELDFSEQDFSDKNKEIDPEEIAKDLNMKCPRCGFEFKGDKGLQEDAQVPVQMESE